MYEDTAVRKFLAKVRRSKLKGKGSEVVRMGPSFGRWELTLHSNGQYTISRRDTVLQTDVGPEILGGLEQ
jgi:hypothetical protein